MFVIWFFFIPCEFPYNLSATRIFVHLFLYWDSLFLRWHFPISLTHAPVLFFSLNIFFLIQFFLHLNQIEIVKQFVGRAATLIVWPIILYMCFFYIHLEVLNHSGNGDGFYSSAFQSQLIGNSLHNATMPRQVAYGAVLTLKNYRTGGGYLHSHQHLYPKGSGARQQQVCYMFNHVCNWISANGKMKWNECVCFFCRARSFACHWLSRVKMVLFFSKEFTHFGEAETFQLDSIPSLNLIFFDSHRFFVTFVCNAKHLLWFAHRTLETRTSSQANDRQRNPTLNLAFVSVYIWMPTQKKAINFRQIFHLPFYSVLSFF